MSPSSLMKTIGLVFLGVVMGFLVTLVVRSHSRWSTENALQPQQLVIVEGRQSSLNRLRGQRESLLSQLQQLDEQIHRLQENTSIPAQISSPMSIRSAHTRLDSCEHDFTVYVYPVPSTLLALQISEEARRNGTLHVCQKCILEQFALEYIMFDFFTQFCGRTFDPEKADFFYLPLVRDAEFRWNMQIGGIRQRAPSASELALLSILEKNDSSIWESVFNITSRYWHRRGGADHIVVMPAPVTNLRHETSKRGFFHYMSHLHSPIFLGLEYSLSFVHEYPICSRQKNIMVPYPTTDPDLYNGKLTGFAAERNALLYYAGGLHGDCVEIRKAMKHLMLNSTRLPGVIPKIRSNQEEREHGFLSATFCPVPVGDSPSSKRMYDVLNFGCIPVILSDDLVWAYSDQTGGSLNHSSFAIQIPQSVVQFTAERTLREFASRKTEFGLLPRSGLLIYDLLADAVRNGENLFENGIYVNPLVHILRRVPLNDIEFLRANGQHAASAYRYYQMNASWTRIPTADHLMPTGGAMQHITQRLSQQKATGIDTISLECQREKNRAGHKYIGRYSCDTQRIESLI